MIGLVLIRLCSSRDAIDIVHIEVAANYVVYCGIVTLTTIGRAATHYRVHNDKANVLASHTTQY